MHCYIILTQLDFIFNRFSLFPWILNIFGINSKNFLFILQKFADPLHSLGSKQTTLVAESPVLICFAGPFASAANLLVAASLELNQLALKPSVLNQMVLKPSDFKSSVAGEAVKVIPLATKLFKPTR